jgi:hypothetical protein
MRLAGLSKPAGESCNRQPGAERADSIDHV